MLIKKRITGISIVSMCLPLLLVLGACDNQEKKNVIDDELKTEVVATYKADTLSVKMKLKNTSKKDKTITYKEQKPFDLIVEDESGNEVFSVDYDKSKLKELEPKVIKANQSQMQQLEVKPKEAFKKGKYTLKMKDNGKISGKEITESVDTFVVK